MGDFKDSPYFTVDVAALKAISECDAPGAQKLKMMVAFVVVTSGKGKGKNATTVWGAEAVSSRTGWAWITCKELIKKLEGVLHPDGSPILEWVSRTGKIISRRPSQVVNCYVPKSIILGENNPLDRMMSAEFKKHDQCALLIVLVYVYRHFNEKLLACPGVVCQGIQEEQTIVDLKYAGIEKTISYGVREDFNVFGVKRKSVLKAIDWLAGEGLIRNIYLAVDGENMPMAVVNATGPYRKMFGNFQEEIRKIDSELRYLPFKDRDYSGDVSLFWTEGDLVRSVMPGIIVLTTNLAHTIETMIENQEVMLEDLGYCQPSDSNSHVMTKHTDVMTQIEEPDDLPF